MQQDKSSIIFDPNQIFPIPFSLIANGKNPQTLTSTPLKQPFAFQVYCPLSCKKIKIGVIQGQNQKQTMEFNTTSSRWISVFVNNDIRYLVNGHNPVKKDKKKANSDKCSIYIEVQDRGNIAIFNPFYYDPIKPLSLYTFNPPSKAVHPSKQLTFTNSLTQTTPTIILNNNTFYLNNSLISPNTHFKDIQDNLLTIRHPNDQSLYVRKSAQELKQIVNQQLDYLYWELHEVFIIEQTGKGQPVQHNLDQIYQKINFYLNVDEQIRIKLMTNTSKTLLSQLFPYHHRVYSALSRLVSFINYGNTRFDVFKLAQVGFYNKSDMLQDLAYIQNPSVPIPSAQQSNKSQQQLRCCRFPFSRLSRNLSFPNISLSTYLSSQPAQTISTNPIILTQISDPYVLFVDSKKIMSIWSGRFMMAKLVEVDLIKINQVNLKGHKILKDQQVIQQVKELIPKQIDQQANFNMFNEPEEKEKPAPVLVPDPTMLQQLLSMGYTLTVANKALLNVKNQSVAVALDQIQKIMEDQKTNSTKKIKSVPKAPWLCLVCTYQNIATSTSCDMCGTQPELVDQEELNKKILEEIQEMQKKQRERSESEIKLKAKKQSQNEQQVKKKRILQQKRQKQDFLLNSQITYCKAFHQACSVNPFMIIVCFTCKKTQKSLLKALYLGLNRSYLTQHYRYENNSFISNCTRNLYSEKENSIQPINSIIKEYGDRKEIFNALVHGYREDQYFVLWEEAIEYELGVKQVRSDGNTINVTLHDKQESFKIQINDNIQKSSFTLTKVEAYQLKAINKPQQINFAQTVCQISIKTQLNQLYIETGDSISQILIQVIEHIPSGKFRSLCQDSPAIILQQKKQQQICMSQFLPIMIQSYSGSIFSSKYLCSSLFQRQQTYISNYPDPSFTFKSIQDQVMFVESFVIISTNKRLQKIFPVERGLVFTADQLVYFQLAKELFKDFTKQDYLKYFSNKKQGDRQFWEPVAFFQFDNQAEFQIEFKRQAKYLFLLPSGVKNNAEKADVAAVKIDFFGVKGRIQETKDDSHLIENYKEDCIAFNTLQIKGLSDSSNSIIKKKSGVNTLNFIPKNYEGLNNIPLSISTFYQIKFLSPISNKHIIVKSQYLSEIKFIQTSKKSVQRQQKQLCINSYQILCQKLNSLTQLQIYTSLYGLKTNQLVQLILRSIKSPKNLDKLSKILLSNQSLKQQLYTSISTILPQLHLPQIIVSQVGLKTILRLFQKLFTTNNQTTLQCLEKIYQNLTQFVSKIRNKNYNILRIKYGVEQLVLQNSLFSKDYYRMIYPNYVEQQNLNTIAKQPNTNLNNKYYLQKLNPWFFKAYIDLLQTRNVQKIDIYFPKISQSVNRYKLVFKIFQINDIEEKLVYYRTFNQELLYQFSSIAYKQKQIYSKSRINYFSVEIKRRTRFLRIQYNYLLVTTLCALKIKQPTQSLILYPIIHSAAVISQVSRCGMLQQFLVSTYPNQTKHSSIIQNLPPLKHSIDRNYSFYQIYQFEIDKVGNQSKEDHMVVDRITTNIMDKAIVQQTLKDIKITNYQFGVKALDFAYTLMVNMLKMFRKMPSNYKIHVKLILQMFDVFVVYEIGPIMKQTMSFITQVFKRLSIEQKSQLIGELLGVYLSDFRRYKQLKQSQKYVLTKILQKLSQLQLPIYLLIKKLQYAYSQKNIFLISMLLKLIKPNIKQFGLNLKHQSNGKEEFIMLKDAIKIVFHFGIWVLDHVDNVKVELLEEGFDLLEIFMNAKYLVVQHNKAQATKAFINQVNQQDIWKMVFLTLKLKNQVLNRKVHQIFHILMQNTTQKFKKSINTMLLQIIKKQPFSMYTTINGNLTDDIWMNHLQTILQYLNIQPSTTQSQKAKTFTLDINTSIQLLNLPLTPVLWAHVLLIIPKEDQILNAIIKNFKKEYYMSLGKEITKFCQPLAGIRSLHSLHINWLDLVKKIRLQGRSIFSLFLDQLLKSSFGGRQGVTMSTIQQVKQLQITSEFLKLVLERPLPQKQLNSSAIQPILVWYFLNFTDQKAQSPASDFLKLISQNILVLIKQFAQNSDLKTVCIKSILQIKKDSQKMQGMFKEKRIPTHSALSLNKRFCKCFQTLINIFVSNDQMSNFFAFQINGLQYIMQKLGLLKKSSNQIQNSVQQHIQSSKYLPEQEFLLEEKILAKKVQQNVILTQIKCVQDLKQQQFATNVKLVASMNMTTSTATTDWTIYKKGNKTKIIFLPMTEPSTYFQYPLYIQLIKAVQIRSIKLGFTSASFQHTDKVVLSPSSVLIEGSQDMKSFEPLGEMAFVDDDGYNCNGVKVFALNLQKVLTCNNINDALKQIEVHRVKYLKIVVKRPSVTFIEGSYSQLNGKPYNSVGCNISFLSVMGDDLAKLPNQMVQSCKQITKKTALNILSSLMSESNSDTMKKISNQPLFAQKIKQNFNELRQLMCKNPVVMPQIIFTIGSLNPILGDWLIQQFIQTGKDQLQAKLINQIIISTPNKIYQRINYFQKELFNQLEKIRNQSEVESSLMFLKTVHFMDNFCKTLEECYQTGFNHEKQNLIIDCDQNKINYIIDIYDKKYSSPQIKSLLKLLISLIWIKKPLQLSQEVVEQTLNLIWKNCSQSKPYFYTIMSCLLVQSNSKQWIQKQNHSKTKCLIKQINQSLSKCNQKSLKSQMFLLSILSYHEADYLREIDYHMEIYNLLKVRKFQTFQVYQYLVRILQNVVLGHQQDELKLAKLLIDDVKLLVKRKDPILQRLFVGLLAVQQEVMVHLKGLQSLAENKTKLKYQTIPSKILSRKEQKILSTKINKKQKTTLIFSTQSYPSDKQIPLILSSLQSSQSLTIFKVLYKKVYYKIGFYCTSSPIHSQQGSQCIQQQIRSNPTSFVFIYGQNQYRYVDYNQKAKMGAIQCINYQEEDQNYSFVIYQKQKQSELLHIMFNQKTATVLRNIDSAIAGTQTASCQFLGMEVFQIKQSINSSTDKKITQLLQKSTQATAPFKWYRHSAIYIFPASIKLCRLEKLLSSKLSLPLSTSSSGTLTLSQIKTNDFIVDLNVQLANLEEEEQFGYIPKMNVFDRFSTQGGIDQVLRLGSQSIKDWKNATRKKNFEHYMDQLKSFIHLPNFFSLFIKSQNYVTFLFQVAAGLPDDSTSNRNWEEQEVNSSRFIYKILSDIFKFDRSKQLRNMDKYQEFCQIILQKLSQISKQAPRIYKQDEKILQKQAETLEVTDKLEKKKTEQKKMRKKKGIGYGADNQNNQKWSPAEWLENKKLRSQQILRVVSILVSFLDCQVPITDARITETIKSSCLLPLVQSSLRSGSLLDISKDSELFKSFLSIVKNLAKNPATIVCLIEIQKNYKPQQTESIHSLLSKLNSISEIFLQCLKSGKQAMDANNLTTQALAIDIQKTYSFIDKAVRNLQKNKNVLTIKQINSLPIQQSYRLLLQKYRFGYVDLKKGSSFQHQLSSSIGSSSPSTQKILRLSQQLADLSSSLPCQHTNSIFVRCDKSRIDVVKILIMGSKDTPYSNGAFMFDLYCDDSYPNNPPKMVITTTGQAKIRFNPNLYSCGKVCLSLLGTWRGSASENWDPKLSTLLQLFISTQGITMSQDIYFNQPGFDGEQGTQQGQKKNEAYSNIVRLGNVRYAMIDQIKNPPKGFQDVVNRHFYIKKHQIIEQCQKWLQWAQKRQASYSGLVSDHNSSWCTQLKASKTKYKQLLEKQVDILKDLLKNLPDPDLKQKNQQEQVQFVKKSIKKRIIKQNQIEIDVGYDKEEKEELKIEEGVMQDRWSRYIGAMGLQAVKKQASSRVLLVGLSTLGLEIAKNLVLSGLQNLTIVQNRALDAGSQEHFFMSNLKGKQISQCIFKIKELNPYMTVNHRQTLPQSYSQFNLVVSTTSLYKSLQISVECRKQGKKFIYCQTCGTSGIIFNDLGQSFQILDPNGQQPFQGLIQSVSSQNQGIVKLLDGIKHPYEDGDYVVLSKVQGMDQIKQQMEEEDQVQGFYNTMINDTTKKSSINGRVFKVKVINWNSFSIGDTTNFKPYLRNGIVKNIKLPKVVNYKSFEDSFQFDNYLDPNLGVYDFEKMGDNFSIFASFLALSKFKEENKRIPENWNESDSKKFVSLIKQINQNHKKSQQQSSRIQKFALSFSLICQSQLACISAYLGGLVSQEIIKSLTNKYTPIKQYFTFHINQLIQQIPEEAKWQELRVSQEEQFRNLKIVVGKNNMHKIQQVKLFVVGAGAIGCQLLKNFAMVNMAAKGMITVTDPDHIQTSNLTRQFLFRQKHVKKPKSATASAVLVQMNPNLKNHISSRLDKVCEQTEDIYSDEFFKNQTIIANALDNVKARQYMDKRCVLNKLPLFQSGTLGPKGHVQVIVPYKTQNYGSQADPNQQTQIPHCTLKMFPQDITHCIEWSRDLFGKVFTLNPKALKKIIDAKDLSTLQGKQKQTVIKMIKFRPTSFQDCIKEAVRIFFKYFRNDIRQLLYTYPIDMKTKEGKLFWSLPKRTPIEISKLDQNDQAHQTFIASYAVLFAKIFSIAYPKDFRKAEAKVKIIEQACKVKVQEFTPSAQKSKQLEELTSKQQKQKQKHQNAIQKITQQVSPITIQQTTQQVSLSGQILNLSMVPQQFQKDQDSNGHIDLIYSMSNLRARNYDLGECQWIDAKLKAGRIMAALSTTTSVVAALQTIQIIKLIIGAQVFRNAFVNLAVPLIQITQPGPALKQKIGNTQFSVWQDWEFKAASLRDLLTQIRDKYQVEGFNISTSQGTPIFWQAMYKDKHQALETILTKKLSLLIGKQKVSLNVLMREIKGQKIYEKVPRIIVQASE